MSRPPNGFHPEILHDLPLPKIRGRGRKKGGGAIQRIFRKMKVGDCIAGLPGNRIESLRICAGRIGVKFHAYRSETGYYVLKVYEVKEICPTSSDSQKVPIGTTARQNTSQSTTPTCGLPEKSCSTQA
jgi:hypothetical protein